jgi:hypothetical protein
LFKKHDLAKNCKHEVVLAFFEQLCGLKINFHTGEIYCSEKVNEEENAYRTIFGCEVGSLPFKYLGIPMHYRSCFIKNGIW